MKDKEWHKWLAETEQRMKRRLETLRAVRMGEVELKRVKVKSYDVPKYTVPTHVRYIPVKRKRK